MSNSLTALGLLVLACSSNAATTASTSTATSLMSSTASVSAATGNLMRPVPDWMRADPESFIHLAEDSSVPIRANQQIARRRLLELARRVTGVDVAEDAVLAEAETAEATFQVAEAETAESEVQVAETETAESEVQVAETEIQADADAGIDVAQANVDIAEGEVMELAEVEVTEINPATATETVGLVENEDATQEIEPEEVPTPVAQDTKVPIPPPKPPVKPPHPPTLPPTHAPLPPRRPKPIPLPSNPHGGHTPSTDEGGPNVVAESKLYAKDGVSYQKFGHSVAASKGVLAVGTSLASPDATRVFIYAYQSINALDAAASLADEAETAESNTVEVSTVEEGATQEAVTQGTEVETASEEVQDTAEDSTVLDTERQETIEVASANELELAATDVNQSAHISSESFVGRRKARRLDSAMASGWNQHQVLSSNSQTAYDGYGLGITLTENFLAVGAPYDDSKGYLSGRVYLYDSVSGTESTMDSESELFQENGTPYLSSSSSFSVGALFGSALASYGTTLAVGAPGDSTQSTLQGTVYLYTYDPETKTWSEQTRLSESSSTAYLHFGSSLSMSETLLAIGATGFNPTASIQPQAYTPTSYGAVYLYERNSASNTDTDTAAQSSSDWSLSTILSPADLTANANFGYMLSFTPTQGLVSAHSEAYGSVVYLYEKAMMSGWNTAASSSWRLEQVFTPSQGAYSSSVLFGQSLALQQVTVTKEQADGTQVSSQETVALIGAPGESTIGPQSGAIYLFAAKPTNTLSTTNRSLRAAVSGSEMFEASSVSETISAESSTVDIVSETTENGLQSNSWALVSRFTGEDATTYASYGQALATDGTLLFVGAELADTPIATMAGAVYMEDQAVSYFLANPTESWSETSKSSSHNLSSQGVWQWFHDAVTSTVGILLMASLPLFLFAGLLFHRRRQHEKEWNGSQDDASNGGFFSCFQRRTATRPATVAVSSNSASSRRGSRSSNSSSRGKYSTTAQNEGDENIENTEPITADEITTSNNATASGEFTREWTVNPLKYTTNSSNKQSRQSTPLAASDYRVDALGSQRTSTSNSAPLSLDPDAPITGSMSIRSPITHLNPATTILVPSPMVHSSSSNNSSSGATGSGRILDSTMLSYRPLPIANNGINVTSGSSVTTSESVCELHGEQVDPNSSGNGEAPTGFASLARRSLRRLIDGVTTTAPAAQPNSTASAGLERTPLTLRSPQADETYKV